MSTEPSVPEQIAIRRDKRQALLDQGIAPYPVSLPITHSLAEIREKYDHLQAEDTTGDVVGVAGRVMFLRNAGKLCFASLQAGDGTRLQAMLSVASVGQESLSEWKAAVDLGDHVFIKGEVISSKRGELSIMAQEWKMAAKTLRPLPTLHNELSEETRVRSRYIDLIVRPQAREMVLTRAKAVASLREVFASKGFVEVETPMLQTLHGGAAARPFSTHSNAFDIDLFLRIAPELFLKRAVVGGIDRVFEINRNFRNEGADSTHSPEFAMVEAYEAYGDYNTIADLTQDLIVSAVRAVFDSDTAQLADGSEYDFGGKWQTLTMYGSLSEAAGVQVTPETTVAELQKLASGAGLDPEDIVPIHGKLVEEIWEHLVGDKLVAPTFVRDFPVETSPLVRQHRDIPGVVEKWDLYVRGFELATGYSELVDPVIQRQRFVDQAALAAAGDDETMSLDEDFLKAMESGMPPTGGMGMGIDRLLMALTGLGIRETVLFPLIKPE